MSKIYLGIDIGGTAVKIGLVDETGTILSAHQYTVFFDNYQTPILETVLMRTDSFLEANTLDYKTLDGIGISATGQIDTGLGIVAGSGGNIKNWEGSNLRKAFSDKYHLPVTVVNDANCVALGEKWVGSAKDVNNVIVLTIGTGLGGGIIVNNQILLGQFGFAGEIGHFSINNQGLPCTCGNAGCFEQYASMTALVKLATAYYKATDPDYLLNHLMNGKTIFEAVANGDSGMLQIVNAWIHSIATGIVSLVHIFNPELVVIGGGVSTQEELFISKLRAEVKQHVMPNFRNNLKLNAATLGNNAGLVGAVYYLLAGLKQNNI
jgi:glucokinase